METTEPQINLEGDHVTDHAVKTASDRAADGLIDGGTDRTIDIETRFRPVNLSSIHAPVASAFSLRIAGVIVRVGFDAAWDDGMAELCRDYWAAFLCEETRSQVEVILSPADGEFIHQQHPMWNVAEPFQKRVEDRSGTWIFHRDFTCHVRGTTYRAWLPRPTENSTDALDNILSISARPEAERRAAFLFHCAVVEHAGRAVVLFGPSGIGKSTAAKMSRERGLRVMASDQAYLRIENHPETGERLLASASPTRNPDIPRTTADWVTGSLEVKTIFALKRAAPPGTGLAASSEASRSTRRDAGLEIKGLEIKGLDRSEMTRRFFAEIFRDETEGDFTPALKFACDVALLRGVRQASLSYPLGFDFWPRAKELGYV